MIPVDYIRSLPLFQGMDDPSLQQLAAAMIAKPLRKLEFAIKQGDRSSDLIFLLRGRLQVVDMLSSGREIGLGFIQEGDFFGELSVFDAQPRSASVIAVEHSVVLILPRPEALRFFYRHPLGSERVIQRLVAKFRKASEHHTAVISGPATDRLLHVLQTLATPDETGKFKVVHLPTQGQLAVMANLARETVARALAHLERDGIVQRPTGSRTLVLNILRTPRQEPKAPG